MTVTLYAEFTAEPGKGPAVHALIRDFAAEVRAEPGNIRFDPHYLQDDPLTVFVYEKYDDQAAFETHLASPHGARFNEELAALVAGGGSALTMLGEIND